MAAAFRRLCVETRLTGGSVILTLPAAFRRLCVETIRRSATSKKSLQPPSGGCVLKLARKVSPNFLCSAAFRRLCVETKTLKSLSDGVRQPPSGGCVLKLPRNEQGGMKAMQPPSGGCVLKPFVLEFLSDLRTAAFRRLCVETGT